MKYRETIWSELYPGNQHTINCFRPAVLAAETALELADRHRRRTVWRMDGGAGSDNQFLWLLGRNYHVVAKGISNFRACRLARQVVRWDSYADYELAEVSPPIDYGRPVRVFVKRWLKDGKWQHSYYISTLQLSSKGRYMTAYHQRGGAEVEQFRQDKQGLYLATRRKGSFTGQQGYILLTDLAHNLLADFHHRALQGTRFEGYGLKRIVRDLLNVPGRLRFEGTQLKRIELLSLKQFSKDLIICLERYCLGE
ncbi:MAG: transposase [Anaerolineaceae bacterium]|nr:MAG: transposase [Anaerolineaceae bacterium]